jgi:autotransporter-associated beta strand protein
VLVLSGTNTFTGGLNIESGQVQLGSTSALNATTPQRVNFNGATVLRLAGNSVSVSGINGGSGTPAAIIENNNATAATLTIASITDLSFDGTLQNGAAGTLALTKTGSSRQTLSGSSSYTGATTINGGTLEIGNGGSTGQLSGLSPISGTSAGTLALNRSADVTIANPISGAVNVVKNGGNVVTYSGTYSSTGTVTVSQGALSVTGSMTATAPTQVNGGVTLGGSGSVGSVNMDGGALLRPGASPSDGSVATLTMGSLKSNGIDIRFDLAPTPAGANDRVAVTNVASFASGTTTITPLFAFNALPSSPGTYTLLTAGTLSVDPGASLSLTAPPTGSRLAYHLNTTTGAGGSVQLVVDSAFGNITWTGANSNVWDVNGATNWQQASNPNDKFFNFDSVTLDDSSAVRSISLGTQVIASTITVNNANYTVSGAGGFTGSNGLNKLGNGQLIIATTNNNYTGTTAIQNGTLSLGASNILPNPANIVLGSGANSGVLDLGGFDATVTSLAVSGTGTGNAVVNNGAAISTSTLTYNNNGNAGTFAAALNDGTGKLALNVASGTLTLTSNNTYSGMTTIAANNALQVGAGGTTGSIGTGDVTNNGTLLFNRTTDTTVSGAISGSGKLIKTNTNKLTLGGGSSYTDQTIITGGTVSFGASNNLGDPNASGNTIAMGGGAALLSTGANVDLGTNRNVTVGTTLGTATFLGGVIDVPGTNVLKISGNIVGANTASNSLTKNGTGKLVLSGDNTGFVNEWIVNGGVIEIGESNDILDGNGTIFFNGNGATLHVTADINLSTYPTNKLTTSAIGGAASTGTFDVDSGKTFTIGSLGGAAVIRTAQGGGLAGGGSFYKAGLGTMVFQGNNQQLDVPVIVMGGTVVATEANSVGGVGGGNSVALNPNTNLYFQNDSSTNYNNAAVASGTTRITIDGAAGTANVFVDRVNSNSGDLTHTVGSLGFNAGGNTLSISPGSHQTGGATSLTFVQGIVMNDNGTLVVQSAGAATMTVESQAPISGTGTFAKSGDGTLILSGTTTVTAGDVRPAGGTIKLASANGLSSNTLDYNNYGGVFTFGAQTAATFGGLKGAQNLALTNDAAGTVTLSVGANNADNTYSGNLTGGGSLTKIGNGTQTLSGNNAYTGGTTLSAGELGIATDSNIGGAASVINFNGGLLRVTGTTLNNLNTHTVNWSTFNGGFDIADSTNTFTVSNNIAGSGGLIKTGAGSLLLTGANSYTGTTSLKAGKLVALGDAARTPLLSGNGTTGGTDITGGQLILDYSPGGSTNPSSTVSTTLTAGYNLPSKFSSGVLRTSATADSTKGLGWRDDGGNKQVTVMYTYFGDAGVDGQVTTADFNQVAAHFNGAGNWAAGDFNYDGIVNALDFNAVATNFGKVALPSQPALGAPVLGTLVPEPGTALLGVVAGLGLMRRRRRGA